MVTCWPNVTTTLILVGVFGLAACGALAPSDERGASPSSGSGGAPTSGEYVPGATAPQTKYPGKGFVVHEWGTNTLVVGSDGSMQRGLHHEEEDLPAFVYDRIKAGELGVGRSDVKMETPVTYFYSDRPLTAKVSVSFPRGVLTQWYPNVSDFYPHVQGPTGHAYDPVMDPNAHFTSELCTKQYALANGLLDWGQVTILPRDESVAYLPATLEQYTWAHARAVASNSLTRPGSKETEKFLFYRGLGNFTLPIVTQATGYNGAVRVSNTSKDRVGSVFVLNVSSTSGAFTLHASGLDADETMQRSLGDTDMKPLDTYADALADAMTAELDKTGLYHDETLAMVNTWKRQWFRTPGVRVLYLAPQAWTDAQIPLKIDPKPDQTTRVMVIRVEVITPAQEDTDATLVAGMEGTDTAYAAATAHFKRLGRFAEPRLRRAMQLLGGGPRAKCETFLNEIAKANTSTGFGE